MDLKTLFLTKSGRVGRQTYWLSVLCLAIANGLLQGAAWLVMNPSTTADRQLVISVGTLGMIMLAALFVVMLVLSVSGLLISIKRCHDRDRSGWFMLASLIPLAGPIWVLVELGFLRGTAGPNRFGFDPIGGAFPGALPA